MRRTVWLALALIALAPVEGALAHPASEGAGSFYGGLLHPLLVPAHALAVTGLALLIGQQAHGRHWPMPVSYAAGLGAGFAAMISAFAPLFTTEALLATAAASGALVALARPVPSLGGCALALAAGAALALDSPPGGASVREANIAVLGTFSGAIILLLAVVELAAMLRRPWQRVGVRIVGSWIAASAVMGLALRLAR